MTSTVTRLLPFALAALVLSGCLAPAGEGVKEGVAPSAAHDAPYAQLAHSEIRGLTPEQIDAYRTGKGASLALPAELNGYPGPAHVLEHAEALGLTPAQQEAMERLRATMRADAVAAGEALLALHARLDEGFRAGTLDAAQLATLLQEIGAKDARLREVHLRTHLEAAHLLTPHQRARYAELRGYDAPSHDARAHEGP